MTRIRPTTPATDNDTLTPQADLSITKTDSVTTIVPGTQDTYTIVVTNNGPSDVTGATVADLRPAGITNDTFTVTPSTGAADTTNASSGSGNINDSVNLNSGSSMTYVVTANVSASATGTLINTRLGNCSPSGVTDLVPANNSATDTDTLTPQADLSITKTDGVTTVVPGTQDTYTIVVTNNGPSDVTGATVVDLLPAGITSDTFTVTPSTGAADTTNASSGSGNINDSGNLDSGSSLTYVVTADISASATGTLINTATVTAASGVSDPTPANNSATDTDTLTPEANLSITNTDGKTSVQDGDDDTYTVVVTNNGSDAATGVAVNDLLPAGEALVSDTASAGAYNSMTGVWTIGNLANGASDTLTVTAQINDASLASLTNTATVSGNQSDPNGSNNSASDMDSVTAAADLTVVATVDNNEPADGTDVHVYD